MIAHLSTSTSSSFTLVRSLMYPPMLSFPSPSAICAYIESTFEAGSHVVTRLKHIPHSPRKAYDLIGQVPYEDQGLPPQNAGPPDFTQLSMQVPLRYSAGNFSCRSALLPRCCGCLVQKIIR